MTARNHDLLKKKYKFTGRHESFERKMFERMAGTPEDWEELKKRVRSILISTGQPRHVSEITRDYEHLFGTKFPVLEMGYSSEIEVLKSIPEACNIEDEHKNDPLVVVKTTAKSVHIFDLVKKNRNNTKEIVKDKDITPREVFVPFNVQDGIRKMFCKLKKKRMRKDEFYQILNEAFDMQYLGLNIPIDKLILSLPHILHHDTEYVRSSYEIEKQEVQIPEHLHHNDEHIVPSYRLSKLESQIAVNICTLLEENEILFVRDIPDLYRKKFGKELNWYLFGFRNLWKFLQLLPGNFKLVEIDNAYVVAPSEMDTSGIVDIRCFETDNYCGENAYRSVLEKIKDLMVQVNEGMNVKYLLSAYETLYYEKLIVTDDFEEFLWNLHDLFIFTLEKSGENLMIYPYNYHDIRKKLIKSTETSSSVSTENLRPDNVLKPGDSMKFIDFPEDITIYNHDFCAGYVASVETPSNFHIRVIGVGPTHERELEKEFIKMKDNMKTFYKNYSEKYLIPVTDIQSNMICAACIKGEWQRAIVLEIIKDVQIWVKLLDEGSRHLVTLINLRYLSKDFCRLPGLAVQASLFNIKPRGESWSVAAILEFRKLTSKRNLEKLDLSILIVLKDKDGGLQVVLTDVNEETEIHIGDKLEELGYASFKYEKKDLNAFFC